MTDVNHSLTEQDIDFLNSVFDLARDNKPVALKSLFDQGVPVDLTNAKGDTLLILAAYHEHADLVQLLINEGPILTVSMSGARPPLSALLSVTTFRLPACFSMLVQTKPWGRKRPLMWQSSSTLTR